MKYVLILSMIIGSSVAFASKQKPMSKKEIESVNFILQCPNELSELSKKADWVGSGGTFNDRTVVEGKNYNFYRRAGFTGSEYAGTLTVSRVRRTHVIPDAPAWNVQCTISDQSK